MKNKILNLVYTQICDITKDYKIAIVAMEYCTQSFLNDTANFNKISFQYDFFDGIVDNALECFSKKDETHIWDTGKIIAEKISETINQSAL